MAVTEKTYTSDGSTSYTFPFEYLKTTDVKVTVDGTAETNFTVPNGAPTTVQFNSGHIPASGKAIRIYRDTNVDNLSATFYAGSAIKSQDLNDNFNQNLYVTQEAKRDAASAWQDGDETIHSTETWHTSDETKVATTKAIESRIDAKIDTALTTDVSGGDGITIVDNNPATGQIRVDLDADIATLKDMQSGAATKLAALTSTELAILDGATVTKDELNILDGVTATKDEINILDGVTATKDEINILDGVTATKDEINILDGVTATKDEINILDGVTATKDEINILDGVTATKDEINILDGVTATKDEINILDGVTATKDEINILDGVTATKDEINILDGVTATKDEINILDGVTATKDELNILDGVTATKDELNKTDGLLATTEELNTLDGVTSNTSELNKLDGYTGSTNDLNIVSGKSFKTSSGTLDTTSDTEIPSSKVIAAHVASSQTAIGGFITIADEVSFPATASMPANGVVVSINNAAGIVVNGSGVSTTGRTTDGTPATVTINNFPSSLNGETLAAGVGLMVTATSTGNTYNYHKILAAETDVKQLSDDINDFNARYRVASSAPGSSNDAGDMYFDTSANKMKVYNGTTNAWDDVASVGNFYINTLSSSSGTGGGNANFATGVYRFTLSNPPTMAQQLIVSINGVIQKPNAGTSQPSEGFAIDGNDIIFAAAPAAGSDYFIVTQGSSVSIGTPSDNTVTSAKIVDGSIVNGDISSTANIALSKLNTSGTADNTKFLRGDGSWTVVDTDLSGDTSPQLGGNLDVNGKNIIFDDSSDGAADDVLKFGAGTDLSIYSDGATGVLNGDVRFLGQAQNIEWDKSNNVLWFKSASSGGASSKAYWGEGSSYANLEIEMLAGGPASITSRHIDLQISSQDSKDVDVLSSKDINFINSTGATNYYMRCKENSGSDQCVELYYGNTPTKRLETTSTGINVTGVINVNGSPLSAAPEVELVADGAIAANKPVVVTSAGKAKEIAEVITTNSPPTISDVGGYGGDVNQCTVHYDSVRDFIFVAERDLQDDINIRTYAWSDASDKLPSQTASTEIQDNYVESIPSVASHPTNGYHVCAWKTGANNKGRARMFNFGTNGQPSTGSDQEITTNTCNNNNPNSRNIVYSPDDDKFIAIFSKGGDYGICHVLTPDYTNKTLSKGSEVEIFGSGSTEMDIFYDEYSNKLVAATWRNNYLEAKVGTISGTSVTWGSAVNIAGDGNAANNGSWMTICGEKDTGKLLFAWMHLDSSYNYYGKCKVASVDGTSFSLGSETTFQGTTTGGTSRNRAFYDPTLKKIVLTFRVGTNSSRVLTVSISGTTPSFTNAVTISDGTTMDNQTMVYHPTLKRWCYFASGNVMRSCTVHTGGAASNLSTSFIGFSSAGYSDGQTAKINVVGNTTTQSSLTAGTKYYVNAQGGLATTASSPSVEAGIALSSTKLLIKG